jgi:hypothetical protein
MKGSFMPHAASDRAPVGFVITAGGHFRIGCH